MAIQKAKDNGCRIANYVMASTYSIDKTDQ